jgi:hypothetical protein
MWLCSSKQKMPRKDRKRFSEELKKFVALANLLGPELPERTIPSGSDLARFFSAFVHLFPGPLIPGGYELIGRSADGSEAWRPAGRVRSAKIVAKDHSWLFADERAHLPMPPVPAGAVPFSIGGPGIAPPERAAAIAVSVRDSLRAIAHQPAATMNHQLVSVPPVRAISFAAGGRIFVDADPFADGFLSALNGADPGRIRICSKSDCGKLFLANRSDKFACSPPCLRFKRVRRHREKGPGYRTNRRIKAKLPDQIDPSRLKVRR